MEANQHRIRYLMTRYTNRSASMEEEQELFELLADAAQSRDIKELMSELMQAEQPSYIDPVEWAPVLQQIVSSDNSHYSADEILKNGRNRKRISSFLKWSVAASVLLFVSCAVYYFLPDHDAGLAPLVGVKKLRTDTPGAILPGRTQAILLLADGSAINLDTVKNGALASQGNTHIVKSAKGELVYSSGSVPLPSTGFNTIQVPRGGRYTVILPDGSRVWLNAASSLKYPTAFNGKNREVTLTGEGYFEVAHNISMPFRVHVNDMMVEVLGTHFNVNAYRDEQSISTTLLEGSVRVSGSAPGKESAPSVHLKPGQQADLKDNGSLQVNQQANLDQVIAWKDNKFEFNGSSIGSIMRQVARWYDVEVIFEGPIPERRLKGKFSRDVNLEQLIEMLRYTGLNITIDNRTIRIG